MLPYDSDGHLLELLWFGLRAARVGKRELALSDKRDGAENDPVRQLFLTEMRNLLAIMEGHLRDVQHDIARVQAALAGLQAP